MTKVILFFIVSLIALKKKFVANEPIIEPLELVLRSTDNEGVFHCNGRVDLQKQTRKLTASIETTNMTSPKFDFKVEQKNSTTIRIRIKPNGYIGVNRISCHWSNNLTFGHTVDLIVGEPPGVILLKERCVAFDRRYVECIFQAPTIGRAFRNGFPRLYQFAELNQESYYRPVPRLVSITNENDLVFHFDPRDRHEIPKRTLMSVNITIRRFGSSFYRFSLEPLHTTKVNFQINEVLSQQFRIDIDHNATGTIISRLCSGHISQIKQDQVWTAVQDIAPTTDLQIPIKRLRSSTEYEVCLKCYYEVDDQSYKEQHCKRTKTSPRPIPYLIISLIVPAVVSLVAIIIIVYRRKKPRLCTGRSKRPPKLDLSKQSSFSKPDLVDDRYEQDPTDASSDHAFISPDDNDETKTLQGTSEQFDNGKYMSIFENMTKIMPHDNRISMDTYDYTQSTTTS